MLYPKVIELINDVNKYAYIIYMQEYNNNGMYTIDKG